MKKTVAIVSSLSLLFSVGETALAKKADTYCIYVDCNAKQSGDGSFDKPFTTPEEAKAEVRRVKQNGYPENGITVMMREGKYKLSEGLKFSEEDSGTKEAPVVWRAYGNEDVSLIGGDEISFSEFEAVTDEKILSRVDASVRDNLYQLDLTEKGIEPYDELGIFGQAAYEMNQSGNNPTNGASLPCIYWDGEDMTLARYPNDGYLLVDKAVSNGNTTDYKDPMIFTTTDKRLERWKNAKDMWVWGMFYWDWADIHLPIKSIDAATGTINTKNSCTYGVKSGQKFYVYNLLEEIDMPGEWYLDKNTNILYMYPLDDKKDANILLAFASKSILSFNQANYITFKDLSIKGTRASCVGIDCSTGINIEYCEVAYASGAGVTANGDPAGRTFGRSTYDCSIDGCHIYNVGSNGIYFHYVGNRGDLTPGNCRSFNNWIHDFGKTTRTYAGAVSTRGVGVDISFGKFYNGPHLAVNPGGNDITVRYNDISDCLQETADSGVIYYGGDTTARGTVIEGNLIHDCTTTSTQHSIHAVYCDDAGAGSTVRKNIMYNIGGNGVFLNGGRDNTVENNIFANLNGVGVILKASFLSGDWYAGWRTGKLGTALFDNVIDWKSEPYQKYPHLLNIVDENPPAPMYNVIQNNVSYGCEGGQTFDPLSSGLTIKQVMEMGTVGSEIVTNKDVGFKDIKKNDFTPTADSEIFKLLPDFEEIETERIGLVTSRERKYLSDNAVAMVVDEPRTYVNWKRCMIDEDNYDVTPFIRDNTAYVPIRYLFESFGADVEWKDSKAVIDYNGKTFQFTNGSDIVLVDGEEHKMAGAVTSESNRIFIPVRSVSNLMDKKVLWKDQGLIIISEKDLEHAFSYDEMVEDMIGRISER